MEKPDNEKKTDKPVIGKKLSEEAKQARRIRKNAIAEAARQVVEGKFGTQSEARSCYENVFSPSALSLAVRRLQAQANSENPGNEPDFEQVEKKTGEKRKLECDAETEVVSDRRFSMAKTSCMRCRRAKAECSKERAGCARCTQLDKRCTYLEKHWRFLKEQRNSNMNSVSNTFVSMAESEQTPVETSLTPESDPSPALEESSVQSPETDPEDESTGNPVLKNRLATCKYCLIKVGGRGAAFHESRCSRNPFNAASKKMVTCVYCLKRVGSRWINAHTRSCHLVPPGDGGPSKVTNLTVHTVPMDEPAQFLKEESDTKSPDMKPKTLMVCKHCAMQITAKWYTRHMKICDSNPHRSRLLLKGKRSLNRTSECKYCSKKIGNRGVGTHMRICELNPLNMVVNPQDQVTQTEEGTKEKPETNQTRVIETGKAKAMTPIEEKESAPINAAHQHWRAEFKRALVKVLFKDIMAALSKEFLFNARVLMGSDKMDLSMDWKELYEKLGARLPGTNAAGKCQQLSDTFDRLTDAVMRSGRIKEILLKSVKDTFGTNDDNKDPVQKVEQFGACSSGFVVFQKDKLEMSVIPMVLDLLEKSGAFKLWKSIRKASAKIAPNDKSVETFNIVQSLSDRCFNHIVFLLQARDEQKRIKEPETEKLFYSRVMVEVSAWQGKYDKCPFCLKSGPEKERLHELTCVQNPDSFKKDTPAKSDVPSSLQGSPTPTAPLQRKDSSTSTPSHSSQPSRSPDNAAKEPVDQQDNSENEAPVSSDLLLVVKPKKPTPSFALFKSHQKAKGVTGSDYSQQWQDLPEDEKQKFHKMFADEKQTYQARKQDFIQRSRSQDGGATKNDPAQTFSNSPKKRKQIETPNGTPTNENYAQSAPEENSNKPSAEKNAGEIKAFQLTETERIDFLWNVVLSALATWKEMGNNADQVPTDFIVPSSNDWPAHTWGLQLGEILLSIKTRGHFIKNNLEHEIMLKWLGVAFQPTNYNQAAAIPLKIHAWTKFYFALRVFKSIYKHLEVPMDFVVPREAPWEEPMWSMKLGTNVLSAQYKGLFVRKRLDRIYAVSLLGLNFSMRTGWGRQSAAFLEMVQQRLLGKKDWTSELDLLRKLHQLMEIPSLKAQEKVVATYSMAREPEREENDEPNRGKLFMKRGKAGRNPNKKGFACSSITPSSYKSYIVEEDETLSGPGLEQSSEKGAALRGFHLFTKHMSDSFEIPNAKKNSSFGKTCAKHWQALSPLQKQMWEKKGRDNNQDVNFEGGFFLSNEKFLLAQGNKLHSDEKERETGSCDGLRKILGHKHASQLEDLAVEHPAVSLLVAQYQKLQHDLHKTKKELGSLEGQLISLTLHHEQLKKTFSSKC